MKQHTLLITLSLMLTASSLLGASIPEALKPALLQAIEANDEGRVRSLIRDGEDVNVEYPAGHPLIHTAATFSTPAITRALLQAGAGTNARNVHGQTPLHCAAKYEHIDNARVLCEHGADATACDSLETTPLHEAASGLSNSSELVELLLSHGAKATTANTAHSTAISRAIRYAQIKKIRALIRHGAPLPQNFSSDHFLNDIQRASLERYAQIYTRWAETFEQALNQAEINLPVVLLRLIREFTTNAMPSDTALSIQDEQAASPEESSQFCTLL